jgi:tRNA threonylcarbamoyladenosine biosynthesis protein TsaB
MINRERKIVLALETAIGGGSVALLKDGAVLDFAAGDSPVSKSDGLLELIKTLLKKNKVTKKEIDMVVVSNGPGSLTGIRVGLATAKGLKDSLQIEYYEVSLLDVLYRQAQFPRSPPQTVISAVYAGRNDVCYKVFDINKVNSIHSFGEMQSLKLREFAAKIKDQSDQCPKWLIITSDLFSMLETEFGLEKNAENLDLQVIDAKLAKLVGLEGIVKSRSII